MCKFGRLARLGGMPLALSRLRAHLRCASGFLLLASCARVQREVPREQQPCIFSDSPRSSLSWRRGPDDFTLSGRVVSVRTGRTWANAAVRLSPGGRHAIADSAGEFEMRGVRGGRYLVEVLAIGGPKASDSVTVGVGGIQLLAAIAEYDPGMKVCAHLTPPPTR